MAMRGRVLIISADQAETAALALALEDAGYQVDLCADGATGLLAVEQHHPDLVVIDWQIASLGGAIFTHTLKVSLSQPPAVIALATEAILPNEVLAGGASMYLVRPADPQLVVNTVMTMLARRSTTGQSVG
jgi:DNA-binding response OmpR family regulator